MTTWRAFIEAADLAFVGAVASIIGLVISLLTFLYVLLSKKAVKQVRDDIVRLNAVADFASAIATMEEIKRLHRESAWSILPERYSVLRKHLISIKDSGQGMPAEQKKALQGAVQQFANFEKEVEAALSRKESPQDFPRLNAVVSRQIDKLQGILVERKNQLGR